MSCTKKKKDMKKLIVGCRSFANEPTAGTQKYQTFLRHGGVPVHPAHSVRTLVLQGIYLRIFRKSVEKIQVSLKSDKNKGYFT